MKKHPWLDALENVSLVGLGVGSVASIVLKEVLYTTTPLALLAVLGLLNRRRLETVTEEDQAAAFAELNQRLSGQVDALNQKVAALPPPETLDRLKKGLLLKNREVATNLQAEIAAVQQDVSQRFAALAQQPGDDAMRQELQGVQSKYDRLSDQLSQVNQELSRVSRTSRLEGVEAAVDRLKTEIAEIQTALGSIHQQSPANLTALQQQVARIDRQLSKLPPPVDASALKQEVAELVKVIADLVPKRDLLVLMNDLKAVQQQQQSLQQSMAAIETAAADFKSLFHDLPQSAVEGDLAQAGPAALYPELQALATTYLGNLRSQLAAVQEVAENLSKQHRQLREQVNQLPKTIDMVALQSQLRDLSRRIPSPETTLSSFRTRIQEVLQQELQYINEQLQALPAAPNYEFVFDLNSTQAGPRGTSALTGSRAILEEALDRTQKRLILIWPWSNQCHLDDALLERFETFLKEKRQLALGWCYLADRNGERLLTKIRRGWMHDAGQHDALQDTLRKLLHLKRAYPDHFQFKILGTSENFLVSDQAFAVLGIADALKTNTAFSELQLKLRTKDLEVIQRLTKSFDNPILAPDDLTAYWNRAVTRYDLGDKAGAIADYSHILHINPDDAITYTYRGLAHYEVEDVEAAIADFTQSIHLNPHQAAVYCNRGFIRSEQGDQWGAINDYSLAIQAQPDFATAYFYRGMVWQKLDDHREAIADYTEAIRLAADSAVAYYYRGLTWQKLENYQAAIVDLEAAVNLFSARGSKTNAQKAQKHLAKLRQLLPAAAAPPANPPGVPAPHSSGRILQGAELEWPAAPSDHNGHAVPAHASGSGPLNGSLPFDPRDPKTVRQFFRAAPFQDNHGRADVDQASADAGAAPVPESDANSQSNQGNVPPLGSDQPPADPFNQHGH